MLLEKAKIYGVDGVGQSNPTLTRTDSAVGLTYTINTSEIYSSFDRCYPWSEMQEQVDQNGNVFIKIPKFYSLKTKNPNGTYKHQLSGIRYEGFTTLFVDGQGNELDYVLVGKYEGSGSSARIESKSGATVLVNITQTNFRNGCKANGIGYQQYDFLIDLIIKELFMIEFATTNCQNIMKGYTHADNAAAVQTGHTDIVATPSGSPTDNTTGTYSCKYRGIENLWGNTWSHCDGMSFEVEKVFICTDPTAYESGKITTPYVYMGNRPMSNGFAKTVTPFHKNPLLAYTSEIGATESTYYSDYYYQETGGQILHCSGGWLDGGSAGLWNWVGSRAAGYSSADLGGRLCYKPL